MSILLYQFVTLQRGGETVKMSERTGEFVMLDELIEEVGPDAVRFMLVSQSANATIDFDLDVAVKHSDENPVYYVQYAHARIASVLKKAAESDFAADGDISLIVPRAELELIRGMLRFPEMVELAAAKLEPHHLPHYGIGLAGLFHSFYKLQTMPRRFIRTRRRSDFTGTFGIGYGGEEYISADVEPHRCPRSGIDVRLGYAENLIHPRFDSGG